MIWTLKQRTRLDVLGVVGSQFYQYAMMTGCEISENNFERTVKGFLSNNPRKHNKHKSILLTQVLPVGSLLVCLAPV